MKALTNNSSEIIVQVKDLKFLLQNDILLFNMKNYIEKSIIDKDDNEYIRFTNKKIIEYFMLKSYILNLSDFNNLSIDEIKEEYHRVQVDISYLMKTKKELIKDGKDITKTDRYINCLKYYQKSISEYLKRRNQNKKLKYK